MPNANISKTSTKIFDAIVIGSGAGGLSAAICLARAGKKVLVLEQHEVPGGWCHSFFLDGHRFSPGVHYIGLVEEGQSTNKLYKGLGISQDVTFFKMKQEAFEHCWIGSECFDYPSNFNDLAEKLSQRFPAERKGIHKYINLIQAIGEQLDLMPNIKGFWQHLTIPFRTKYIGKYGLFTLKRVINWHLKDPLLKAILNIQYGDHGLPPSKASFILHAAVMCHYAKGGSYPLGGGAAIVKAMTKRLKLLDGELRTSTSVEKIILDPETQSIAKGVLLRNGEQLYADTIISNADPHITYKKLIGEKYLSKSLLQKLEKTKYSCTSLMLFLVLDTDVTAYGLDSGNIWMTAGADLDANNDILQTNDITEGEIFNNMFISCTTLKDPTSFDGKHHALEVITYATYDAFSKFHHETDERSEAYLKFKKTIIEKFLNTLTKFIPTVKEHVVSKELGTPLTNQHYVNTTNGAVYGTEKSIFQIGPFGFKPKSMFKNLYLCGASIAAHGVTGASYSGVQTAAKILGCRQEDLLQTESGQNIQIYDAEDDTNYPEWLQKKIDLKKKKGLYKSANKSL